MRGYTYEIRDQSVSVRGCVHSSHPSSSGKAPCRFRMWFYWQGRPRSCHSHKSCGHPLSHLMTHSSRVLFSFLLSETFEASKLYNLSKGMSVTLEICHPLSSSAPSTMEH